MLEMTLPETSGALTSLCFEMKHTGLFSTQVGRQIVIQSLISKQLGL